MDFNPGDVVKLKSGGPPMTVKNIGTDGEVWCQWFDANTVKSDHFPPTSLRVAQVVGSSPAVGAVARRRS